jgi:hypothetical protein
VLVVGALAEQVIDRVQQHPEAGLGSSGVLGDGSRVPRVRGAPVIGDFYQLRKVLALSGARCRSCSRCRANGAQLEALPPRRRAGRRALVPDCSTSRLAQRRRGFRTR